MRASHPSLPLPPPLNRPPCPLLSRARERRLAGSGRRGCLRRTRPDAGPDPLGRRLPRHRPAQLRPGSHRAAHPADHRPHRSRPESLRRRPPRHLLPHDPLGPRRIGLGDLRDERRRHRPHPGDRRRPAGASDIEPAFYPSGRSIVFVRRGGTGDPDGRGRLYSIGLDGTGLRPLTSGYAEVRTPAVSPTGRQIVFECRHFRHGLKFSWEHICSIRPDGSHRRDLTPRFKDGQPAVDPDFSPDGRLIAFSVGPGIAADVFMVQGQRRAPRRPHQPRPARRPRLPPPARLRQPGLRPVRRLADRGRPLRRQAALRPHLARRPQAPAGAYRPARPLPRLVTRSRSPRRLAAPPPSPPHQRPTGRGSRR